MTKTASPEVNTTVLKLNAINANHASMVKALTEPPTHVPLLDHLAHATRLLTTKINAKLAQQTNLHKMAVSAPTILVSTDMPIQMPGTTMFNKLDYKEEL
jgi:hypothetical protein